MLREVPARQIKGEPTRRWFTSPNMDLYVWTNGDGAATSFQLCYDKQVREHALTWTEAGGFSHMAVDGGESRPTRHKGAPILVADGSIDGPRLLDQFRQESTALPADFIAFIESRIARLS